MPSNDLAAVFAPLLLLVVTEISSVARGLDLTEIAASKHPPFFVGLFYALHRGAGSVRVPQLGRFNFIHGANLAFVTLGFVLVTESTTGSMRAILAGLTWIVWALLPLFEVDEYEAVLEKGRRPKSFYLHLAASTASAATIYGFDAVCRWLSIPSPTTASALLLAAICLVLFYVGLFGFLRLLEGELAPGA